MIKIKDIFGKIFFPKHLSKDNNKRDSDSGNLGNQRISAKDQKRAKEFDRVELSKQDLDYIKEDKKQSKTVDAIQTEKARFQIIEALFEGLHGMYDDEQYKKASIDSFARSRMPIEEIKTFVNQVREFQNMNNKKTIYQQGTKLPQRSTERNDDFIK